jgi:hypothetical protein
MYANTSVAANCAHRLALSQTTERTKPCLTNMLLLRSRLI